VGVGRNLAVKTLFPVDYSHGNDLLFFLKELDVPVNRRQGQIRNPGLEPLIHPLDAGMGLCGLDNLKYGIPFAAVLPFRTGHCLSLQNNNDNYY
jgi:hypothetical protein